MRAPRFRYYLNVRAALILTALGLVLAVGLRFLWVYQEERTLRDAMKQIEAFREAGAAERDAARRSRHYELALRHLGEYLASRPDDPDALEIQARLMAEGAANSSDLLAAASVYEHLLRTSPDGARAQDARRHLAELWIGSSDLYRQSQTARILPAEISKNLRYYPAELYLDQLLDPRARPRVDDAEAHRLRAMALEGQILPDRTVVLRTIAGKEVEVDLLQRAIDEYTAALRRDPGDMIAAQRLAHLYGSFRKDNAAARRVLDGLLKARPEDVTVRLVRYQFFKSGRDQRAATGEIEAAVKLAPEDLSVLLLAAEDALQADHKDTERARRWLNTVPEDKRDDLRVLKMQGTIEMAEGQIEAAVGTWRKGLEQTDGADPDLCWRLAYALFQLGRDDEAGKLVVQYRRLAGDTRPALEFLEAIQDERAGRIARAIEHLQAAREGLGPELQESIALALGRCQEKQNDRIEAEQTYRAALQTAPESAPLRVALAQLVLATRPADAEQEIKDSLAAVPDNPALLVILAHAKLLQQLDRAPERRNWADFDAAFARASAAAPGDPLLVLLHSERLAKEGGLDQAIAYLKETAGKAPKNAEVAIGLARCLVQKGQLKEALAVLEQASAPEAAGDRASLRIQRAQVLTALGRGREARAMLVHDVERLATADQALVWKALTQLCGAQGDQDATRAALENWARMVPADPEPKMALLEIAIGSGDEPSIRARLEALRPRGQDEDDLVWRLAQAQERLWRRTVPDTPRQDQEELLKEAKALVEGVLRNTKINSFALLLQGQIYEAEGDWEKAIDSYTRARTHGQPSALPRLVELLTRHGRKEELAKLRQSEAKGQVDQLEALTFLKNGNKEEAANLAEQSLRSPSPTEFWQVGVFNVLGTSEKTEGALRKIAEQDPGSLRPWLVLLRFQATHDHPQAIPETIAQIKRSVRTDRPELLEAKCRWAANDRAAADQAFARALERHADDREVEQAAILYYEETGQHDRTVACLRRALARSPEDRTAARQIAVVLSAQADRPGSWEEAWETLGPESSADQTPEERLTRAIVLARSPEPARREQAIRRLEELVADLPAENNTAIAAREILARILLMTGKPDQAARLVAVTAGSSSSPEAIALHIEALLASKQFDKAEAQIDRLAMVSGDREENAGFRARLVQERSQPGGAALALEQTYLERENHPDAEVFGREAFRLLLGMGPDASEVALRLGRRLAEHNPALSWMPAQVLGRRGERDAAITLCQAAAQAQAGLSDLMESGRVALEVAVSSQGDSALLGKADAVLDAALRHAPDADDLLVVKAMLCHVQGRFEDEVRLYRRVLEHQPRHHVVLNNIAYALSEGLDRPSAALDYINKLIGIAGPNPEYLDTRGMILVRLGQFDKAIEDLEKSAQSRPDGTHLFHLALAYQRAGRIDESQSTFAEAQKAGLAPEMIDPNERAALEKLRNL